MFSLFLPMDSQHHCLSRRNKLKCHGTECFSLLFTNRQVNRKKQWLFIRNTLHTESMNCQSKTQTKKVSVDSLNVNPILRLVKASRDPTWIPLHWVINKKLLSLCWQAKSHFICCVVTKSANAELQKNTMKAVSVSC